MNLRNLVFSSLCLFSAVSAFGQSNENFYSNSHTVRSVEGDDIDVVDTLKIEQTIYGQAKISFLLNFDNGGTCSMDNALAKVTNHGYFYTEQVLPIGETQPVKCDLQIKKVGSTLVLHDVNDGCQRVYCGVARIEGARFQIQN